MSYGGQDTGAAGAQGARARGFRDRLRAGDAVLGAWLTVPELSVAEAMSGAGFDYVIIDAEHSPWTIADVQTALAAFSASPTTLLVRIPSHDAVFIKQVLDVGIDGIVCPIVRTAEEARLLVSETRYPPAGIRGYGPRRAAGYGRVQNAYTQGANDGVLVIPQIEDAAFVDEVDAMLEVDGIDALCLGPTDLSGSLGLLRQFDHPEVVRVLDEVMAKAKAKGVAVCTGIVLPVESQAEWIAKGARMALLTADLALVVDGSADVLGRARAVLGD